MKKRARISVIIPALDEARAIGKVISAIPRWVDEVIVVDNGSTDETVEVAEARGARVIVQPQRGYGAACLTGMRCVEDPDVVVFLDGDFSDHPEEMDRLVDPIVAGEADLVIGSRVLGRRQHGALTPQARFGNWLACRLIRLFWGVRHTDLGPFRAIEWNALRTLGMGDRDFGWTVEMQVKAAAAGLRVRDVPVSYRRRIGRSKISGTVGGVIRAGVKILGTILVHALRRAGSKRVPPTQRLVVFTRYPEPGKAKTRLISHLGRSGAAELQRQMTRHVLGWADELRRVRPIDVEVRFEGGGRRRMAACFGPGFDYVPQGDGDLGRRMNRAVVDVFNRGFASAVIIGSDCPDLTADHLSGAFDALAKREVVLGPATDGGYYLIGLKNTLSVEDTSALFADISWGTRDVFQQTREACRELGLEPVLLDPLDDVDRPEDIDAWTRASGIGPASPPVGRISVIIPTLNEAEILPRTLEKLSRSKDVEIVVSDGGSRDETVQVAEAFRATVVRTKPDRATQMNAGAERAGGDALLFLHADTVLPIGAMEAIREALVDPGYVGGAFAGKVDSSRRSLKITTWGLNLRSRRLGLPYGDQGIFVRTDVFRDMGGYRRLPIMEDVDFVRRLRRRGRLAILPDRILISDRRWIANGPLRTMLVNWMGMTLYGLGMSPGRLRRLYDRLLESGKPITEEQAFDSMACSGETFCRPDAEVRPSQARAPIGTGSVHESP